MINFSEFLRDIEIDTIEEQKKKNLKRFVVLKKDEIEDSFKNEFDAVIFITKQSKKPLEVSLTKGGYKIVDTKTQKL